jgi:hypothetical protein
VEAARVRERARAVRAFVLDGNISNSLARPFVRGYRDHENCGGDLSQL